MPKVLIARTFIRALICVTIITLVFSQDFPSHKTGRDFEEFARQYYPHLQNLNIDNLKRDLSENPTVAQGIGLAQGTIFSDLIRYKNAPENLYDQLFENLTANCANHIKYTVEAVRGFPQLPETWVLQMVDAWRKFPSGILSGHLASVGDMEECMQVRGQVPSVEEPGLVEKFRGKYCNTYLFPGSKLTELGSSKNIAVALQNLNPGLREAVSLEVLLQYLFQPTAPPMIPSLGTCFPASCSSEDVQQFFVSYHKYVSQDWVSQMVAICSTDEAPTLKAEDWVMIVILAGIVFLCIVGTALDVYGKKEIKKATGMKAVLAFSFYTNTKSLLNTKVGADNFTCLNGIRFLTSAWILLCHTFSSSSQTLKWNNVDVKLLYKDWTMYPLLNGSLSVDTFFLMSGFLVAFNLLKMLDKTKGKFNYFFFVLHRYFRLTPVVAVLFGITATIAPYGGHGYYWYEMDMHKELCHSYWWQIFLYISNLFKPKGEVGKCYNLTWYLDVDMQLFILSPLVIIPLWKWKKFGVGLLTCLSLSAVAIRTFITAHFHQHPTSIPSIPGVKSDYYADLYQRPWVRFDAYSAGLALGYIFYLKAKQPARFRNISKIVIMLGWILSTVFAISALYGGMYYFQPENVDSTLNSAHAAAYGGLHRFVWSLSIAWIIFACVNGYGGWADKILSMKIFIPLGRLTFSLYLVQGLFLNATFGMRLHPTHFSIYTVVLEYLGLLLVNGFAAYILVMCVEAPFTHLAKMVLPNNAPLKKIKKDKDESVEELNGNIDKSRNDGV